MNTKLSLIALLTALLLQLTGAMAQNGSQEADNIVGLYWSPKKDAKIEIYKKGTAYYGKSVWVATPKKDVENPDKTLRHRAVLGIELLTNFRYSEGEYTGGTIYDPESGTTYQCKMRCNGTQLKVRGYIGISLFGRTETFERIITK